MLGNLGARALLALVWLLHWLPLSVQAAIGVGLGRVLHALAGSRRRIALAQPGTVPARVGRWPSGRTSCAGTSNGSAARCSSAACCGTPAPNG